MKRISGSIVFLIGDFDNSELQKKIDDESEKYGDILQGKFEEEYHKLAFKSMNAFHWSKHFCPKVPWIVKTDDDTVNSIRSLQEVVQAMERDNLTNTIACAAKTDPVHRPGSSALVKWQV